MILSEIQQQIYDRLGYSASPAAEVVRRLLGYINITNRKLAAGRGLGRLRRTVLTTACVANSPYMVLPQCAVRIVGIQDRITQKSLKEITLQDIRFADPGLTRLTSNPDAYAVLGLSDGAAVLPSTADEVYVKSDDAGDVGSATIEYVTTGGYYRRSTVTMTGTTAVAFPATDIIDVRKFSISAAAVGNVTLHEGSGGGTELSRIPITRQSARYTRVHLYGTPSDALTYYCDVELHIEDLASAWDEPFIPEDFQWLYIVGALREEYLKREKMTEFAVADRQFTYGLGELKKYVRTRTDDGRSGKSEFSQLGPYFPADSF